MDRLTLLRTFIAAVDAGSFTAAADHLRGDPKLVSKHVAALERIYRLRLFNRTTRYLSVTDAGRRLYDGALELLARHDELEAAIHADATVVAGRLRISAPVSYGEVVLLPLLRRFMAQNRQVEADLRLSDRFVELSEEGFDLAVRIGGPELSVLVGRRISQVRMILVAAPDLVTSGDPQSLQDLAQYAHVADSNLRGGHIWPLLAGGEEVAFPVRSKSLSPGTLDTPPGVTSFFGFSTLPRCRMCVAGTAALTAANTFSGGPDDFFTVVRSPCVTPPSAAAMR